ncbi:aminopeptidase P N-terminal domain-containing protein, partial [Gemmatimonadota bacterium]
MTQELNGFSSQTFARRRARALDELHGGAMVLPAAPLLFRSRDTEHRYRPDSEIFYLTGCTEPGAVALLRGGEVEDPFILFLPRRDPKAELWSGPRLGPEGARERFGADGAYAKEDLDHRLPELLKASTRLHFRLGAHPRLDALMVGALQA